MWKITSFTITLCLYSFFNLLLKKNPKAKQSKPKHTPQKKPTQKNTNKKNLRTAQHHTHKETNMYTVHQNLEISQATV